MQFKRMDASFNYRSLDVPFHFDNALTSMRTAFYNHWPKSEDQFNVKIGDHFYERIKKYRDMKGLTKWFDQAINGKGWDSYFYASNDSTKQTFYKLYLNYNVFEDIYLF